MEDTRVITYWVILVNDIAVWFIFQHQKKTESQNSIKIYFKNIDIYQRSFKSIIGFFYQDLNLPRQ